MSAAPPHPISSSQPAELPGIEAVRAIAAALVLISHYAVFLVEPSSGSGAAAPGVGLWGLAATGVDLFFVLSGFVFARSLLQPVPSWSAFWVRRAFRVFPLYLVAVVLYALLKPEAGRWDAFPAHLFMLHTWELSTATAYNVAFWSLPPEIEFYLLLPLLAAFLHAGSLGAWCAARPGRALTLLLATMAVLKLGVVALATPHEAPDSLRRILSIHWPGLGIEFVLGVAAAVAVGHAAPASGSASAFLGRAWSPQAQRMSLGMAFLLLAALVLTYQSQLSTPVLQAAAPLWLQGSVGAWSALVAALVLAGSPALLAPRGRFAGLAWLGRWSFGIYLFHNAAPVLVQRVAPGLNGGALVAASVSLTLGLAVLTHWAIEAPCRRWGRQLGHRWSHRQSHHVSHR